MAAMRSILPNNCVPMFLARSASFKCRTMSPLNPSTVKKSAVKLMVSTNISSTKSHLSNLEKLLRKQPLLANSQDPQVSQAESPSGGSDQSSVGGILRGFDLAKIWAGTAKAAVEEMSPRNLSRLQRLLSLTPQYSPRNDLGARWREYHGCRDWAGLLDPLDENLRREVVRYGELVQAAYEAFHSNPEMPTGSAPGPHHVSLPDKSYKVTKSLYATSSLNLPGFIDDVAPDWMTQKSSWIGYVAVCDDEREIRRMGRRDIVIALRGTSTCLEWAENLRAQLVQIPDESDDAASSQPKVECGFLSLYKTPGAHVESLAESVVEEARRLVELYDGEPLSITVTGHSLGAALSVLVADELSESIQDGPPVAVFSFGSPRVGNAEFADRVRSRNVKVLRIVNNQDLITQVPGPLGPWEYADVGIELRVDTRKSPYLKPGADVACCHDLEAYLHLVDGFSGPNCPFRANAKRSLVKLLNEQRSNVKKLYTSKAKALRPLKVEADGQQYRPYRLDSSCCLPSPS